MGGNTQHLTDTPDPEDTGAVGVPENGNPDETTVFQQVGLVEDADTADSNGQNRPKWLVPAIAAGVAVVVLGAGVGGRASRTPRRSSTGPERIRWPTRRCWKP